MSQLLAPAQTVVDGIPLWRRIRELMKEKGSRYSISAVAIRLGISRETLRLMLNGEREIYWFELERISEDLKLSVARILQEDQVELYEEIKARKVSLLELDMALDVAKRRFNMAQGLSEKAYTWIDIGYFYFHKEEYTDAKLCYMAAGDLIEKIGFSEQENELMYAVQRRLVVINIFTKEIATALKLLRSNESLFMKTVIRQADYLHMNARCQLRLSVLVETRKYLLQTLEKLKGTGQEEWVGVVYSDLGYVEYLDLNYEKAHELMKLALQHLRFDGRRLLVIKDLVKVQLRLNELQVAEALIRKTLAGDRTNMSKEMEARFLILLSRVKGVPFYAETVAGHSKYPTNVRFLAGRFLRIFYRRWFLRGRSKRVTGTYQLPQRRFPYDKYL
ncbi:hypothetical protein EV586_101220 [Tumebacillus sp. BK434]|uniref:helix-turn-helix domain-containing protein n=1 Tax=Tumebacillus sp. BK434 TaxID=2512169 RepID=UPI001050EB5B|nr:helix-turn-helix transcriptional regulator [Tumebacillus sp. BK434]TCP59021.1 hypothetical protein EV586_101220 [Tumebacillus sp. BK434]